MQIDWKRSMLREEHCIFPNPDERSQAHLWYNCKDLGANITLIPKILPLLQQFISQGGFDKRFGKLDRGAALSVLCCMFGQLVSFLVSFMASMRFDPCNLDVWI
ncbi:hypothetical protein AVEN_150370-1 [Araneus ventricosus]|uniref:Uncharacterized protein n=1 Tax=Araneus ventricosus TaxID=182803 RepID=A0A4Y2CTE5_ARAVE|nr:hypothetical protein AVEN_150370-1 [Araneus ventricosus]